MNVIINMKFFVKSILLKNFSVNFTLEINVFRVKFIDIVIILKNTWRLKGKLFINRKVEKKNS